MNTVTGNPERDHMIFDAIKKAIGDYKVLSLPNIAANLPPDFDLLPAELVKARRIARVEGAPMIDKTPDGQHSLVAAEPTPPDETIVEDHDEPRVVETPSQAPEAKLTQQQARKAVEQAAHRVAMARIGVRGARSGVQAARAKLATAIEAWQRGGPVWTPAMEARAMAAAYQDQKANVRPPLRRIANSVVDRNAAYSTGGDANDFARRQMTHGGSHRGAYPRSMLGRQVQVKPPSER